MTKSKNDQVNRRRRSPVRAADSGVKMGKNRAEDSPHRTPPRAHAAPAAPRNLSAADLSAAVRDPNVVAPSNDRAVIASPNRQLRRGPVPTPPPAPRLVYLLISNNWKKTYIGSTANVERRLRQHNRQIAGGAWYTSLVVKKGGRWNRAMHLTGFPNHAAAYKFEAAWKKINKKQSKKLSLIERKMNGLREVMKTLYYTPRPVWGHFQDLTWEEDKDEDYIEL
jgi:predicted GIY-YIG superfamily endonuclease